MKRIALLGMPNTGKSTLFNRMTGGAARVGNWPGITVELLSGRILLGGDMVEIIDLPGIYDLHGFSDDEQVVRHFLHDNVPDLALIVLNATQIERQMSLLLQLKQLDMNVVVLLNMADEAKKYGITIDSKKMAEMLGMPIFLLSGKYGNGYQEALQAVTKALRYPTPGMAEELRAQLEQDEHIEAEMARVMKHAVQVPAQLPDNLTEKLDRVMLHPWLGLPLFFGIMYLLFQGIFILGQPLQTGVGGALGWLRTTALEPAFAGLPPMLHGFLLDGIYNGVATVVAFVPIIVLFFLFMAMVEDSGYLSRAAFLMDALMARMGLDGRGFVMLLMGFGCNVPALMGTRVMRSRTLRLLTMLVIPFSLCSARLQVFVFITAALFAPDTAPLVLFSLYLFSFATAILTALVFRRRFPAEEPFVLELPPYRFPTLRQMTLRGLLEVQHFLGRAT
ncbi:MAG TPA: ferrous iron transporter B, partial [Gallionella sp.]|nr:ferrous iron transporter B [Gallionella sp.]